MMSGSPIFYYKFFLWCQQIVTLSLIQTPSATHMHNNACNSNNLQNAKSDNEHNITMTITSTSLCLPLSLLSQSLSLPLSPYFLHHSPSLSLTLPVSPSLSHIMANPTRCYNTYLLPRQVAPQCSNPTTVHWPPSDHAQRWADGRSRRRAYSKRWY